MLLDYSDVSRKIRMEAQVARKLRPELIKQAKAGTSFQHDEEEKG